MRALILAATLLVVMGCGSVRDTRLTDPVSARVTAAQVLLAAQPAHVPASTTHSQPYTLTGDRRRILVRTTGGDVTSSDQGRTWRPLPEALVARYDFFAYTALHGGALITTSHDHHDQQCDDLEIRRLHSVRHTRAPGCRVGRVAFAGDHHILLLPDDESDDGYQPPKPIYSTRDDGRTWTHTMMPKGLSTPNALSADGNLAAAMYPALRQPLVVSRDAGRSWRRLAAKDDCLDASVAGEDIWMICDRRVYYSPDAGHRWVGHLLLDVDPGDSRFHPDFTLTSIVATGNGKAIAATYGTSLLATVDGGAHWRQRWPTRPYPSTGASVQRRFARSERRALDLVAAKGVASIPDAPATP